MRKILFIASFFLASLYTQAETYRFRHFGEAEGIPTQFIYTIDQSETGHLLIGTDLGLFTFDGQDFELIPTDGKAESDFIKSSFQDESGAFWFGLKDGDIQRYDGEKLVTIDLGEEVISSAKKIIGGPDGSVWVITQTSGIVRIDSAYNTTHFFDELEGLFLYTGAFVRPDLLMIGSSEGIIEVTIKGDSIDIEFDEYVSGTAVQRLAWDHGEYLYVASEDAGLFRVDITAEEMRFEMVTSPVLDLKKVQVQHMDFDAGGDLWLSTNSSGLIKLFDRKGREFNQYVNYNEEGEIGTKAINISFRDAERNLWVGTIGGGLLKLVDHYFSEYVLDELGVHGAVWDVVTSGDTLWYATDLGVTKALKSPHNVLFKYTTEHGLPEDGGYRLAIEDDGTLWVGTRSSGLFILDPGATTFESLVFDRDLLSQNINDILIEENEAWIATSFGLYQLRERKVEARYRTNSGMPHNVIESLFRDSKNRLWLGTTVSGVVYVDGAIRVVPVPQIPRLITSISFTEDAAGRIWIGTDGDGVIVFDDTEIDVLTKADGLVSNNCYSLLTDDRNSIWMGHRGALTKVNAENMLIETHERKDETFFLQGSSALGRNDMAWFGSTDGMLRYNPEQDFKNTIEPPVHIYPVDISDSLFTTTAPIDLDYGAYRITFRYTGVSFRKHEQVRYRYILEGHDLEWSELTTDNTIRYNRLDAGEYVFKVTAFNNDGVGGEQVEEVQLVIDSPFWAKWWFYAILIASAVVVVRSIIVRRESRMRENQNYLQRELDARTREVVEQKELLEVKNKDITDSIVYAKNIQSAIIPSPEKVKRHFTDSFVFYKPRDIVSGDFYWVDRFGDHVILACADCTGHGVPGAFMSLISSGILKQVATWSRIHSPSEALREIDHELCSVLANPDTEQAIQDGMDISLVEFNVRTMKLRFSSARRPVIVYQNGERKEIKGDRHSVGGSDGQVKNFTLHEMQLNPGDTIYQFSDGITDQFGGQLGKKLKKQRLLEWLDSIAHLDMAHQGRVLRQHFFSWKGSQSQVDDVLMMGIRI